MHVIGYAGIGEACSKSVIGSVREHAAEGDAAISIEIDQVFFRRTADHSSEYANTLWIFAARHAPNKLINNSVHSPVGLNRHRIWCDGYGHARAGGLLV